MNHLGIAAKRNVQGRPALFRLHYVECDPSEQVWLLASSAIDETADQVATRVLAGQSIHTACRTSDGRWALGPRCQVTVDGIEAMDQEGRVTNALAALPNF